MAKGSRVQLPPGVRTPFQVYVNGVRQQLGVDDRVSGGDLVSERELCRKLESAPGRSFWGIGPYKRNDEVDMSHQLEAGRRSRTRC